MSCGVSCLVGDQSMEEGMEGIATLYRTPQNSAELTLREATILIKDFPSLFRAQLCCQTPTFCKFSSDTAEGCLVPMLLVFASFPHFLHDTCRVGRVGVKAPSLRSFAGAASSGP